MTPFRRAQWRILLATSFCYLFYYTGRQNFGWAVAGLRQDLGLTNTQIGWISGAALACYGLGQVASGRLADRWGGRRLVALGAVLSCGLNWVTSFGQGFWSVAVPWGLNHATQSLGFAPGTRLLVNWWPGERGKAFGVYTFAAGFSSVLTFAGALLVLDRLPWRWVFRLPVLLMLLGALVFYLLARDRPEDLGLRLPAGPASGADPGAGRASDGSLLADARTLLGNGSFVLASLGFGLNNWGRLGLLTWVPVHLLGPRWQDEPGTAWIAVALPLGMAVGAFVAGYGTDRFLGGHHVRSIVALLLLASLTASAMFFVPREARLVGTPLLFLAGFCVFGPIASFTALATELVDRRLIASAVGLMNALGYAAAALGDLVTGVVLDRTGRTESVFLVTAAVCAAGALASLGIGRRRGGG